MDPLIPTVLFVHILAVISPGPDFIMTVRNALAYSRRAGVFTALGIGAGLIVHISYCVMGLALIISKSILLFNAIKLLGAAYLIFIGVQSLFAKSGHIKVGRHAMKDLSAWQALRIGFLTNVFNPKATLYFLGLFSLVIAPTTPFPILAFLSVMMIVIAVGWFCLVALFLTQTRVRSVYESFQGAFNKFFGVVLVGIGLKIALTRE